MINLTEIFNNEWGITVRAKINSALQEIINGKEGLNNANEALLKVASSLSEVQKELSDNYEDLQQQVMTCSSQVDKAKSELLTMIEGMNGGGVSALADTVSYDPRNLPTSKACIVLTGLSGVFINLLNEDGNPIEVEDNGFTIFYRPAGESFWTYQTIYVSVNTSTDIKEYLTTAPLKEPSADDTLPLSGQHRGYVKNLPKGFAEKSLDGKTLKDGTVQGSAISPRSIKRGHIGIGEISLDCMTDEVLSGLSSKIWHTLIDTMFVSSKGEFESLVSPDTPANFTVYMKDTEIKVGVLTMLVNPKHTMIVQRIFTCYGLKDSKTIDWDNALDSWYTFQRTFAIPENGEDEDFAAQQWSDWVVIPSSMFISEDEYSEMLKKDDNLLYYTYEE